MLFLNQIYLIRRLWIGFKDLFSAWFLGMSDTGRFLSVSGLLTAADRSVDRLPSRSHLGSGGPCSSFMADAFLGWFRLVSRCFLVELKLFFLIDAINVLTFFRFFKYNNSSFVLFFFDNLT